APTDPEVEAAVAQVIQRGDFLGQTHRVSQGQQEDGCPNAEPARAGGDSRPKEKGSRSYRRDGSRSPWGSKVAFGQPDAVEAQGFLRLPRPQRLVKRLPLRPAFPEVAFHHQPDVHTRCPSASSLSPSLPGGCVNPQSIHSRGSQQCPPGKHTGCVLSQQLPEHADSIYSHPYVVKVPSMRGVVMASARRSCTLRARAALRRRWLMVRMFRSMTWLSAGLSSAWSSCSSWFRRRCCIRRMSFRVEHALNRATRH